MRGSVDVATLAAALACGLMAGVWFAFSTFVMRGLAALPAPQGVMAMQSINRTAITPLFMLALFGAGAACLGLGVWAGLQWGDRRAPWVLAGAALYLVGTIGVTVAGNVPRNDRLAAVEANAPSATRAWAGYLREWTALNHVRAISSLAAAALLVVALTRD